MFVGICLGESTINQQDWWFLCNSTESTSTKPIKNPSKSSLNPIQITVNHIKKKQITIKSNKQNPSTCLKMPWKSPSKIPSKSPKNPPGMALEAVAPDRCRSRWRPPAASESSRDSSERRWPQKFTQKTAGILWSKGLFNLMLSTIYIYIYNINVT